jgi:hypothetical protein
MDSKTRVWLPTKLLLDQDLIQKLYAFHRPPYKDLKQFTQHVRQFDPEDVQELLEPWLESLSGIEGPLVKKTNSLLLSFSDIAHLWTHFGHLAWKKRRNFRDDVGSAHPDKFMELIEYYAQMGDSCHFSRKAKGMVTLRSPRTSLRKSNHAFGRVNSPSQPRLKPRSFVIQSFVADTCPVTPPPGLKIEACDCAERSNSHSSKNFKSVPLSPNIPTGSNSTATINPPTATSNLNDEELENSSEATAAIVSYSEQKHRKRALEDVEDINDTCSQEDTKKQKVIYGQEPNSLHASVLPINATLTKAGKRNRRRQRHRERLAALIGSAAHEAPTSDEAADKRKESYEAETGARPILESQEVEVTDTVRSELSGVNHAIEECNTPKLESRPNEGVGVKSEAHLGELKDARRCEKRQRKEERRQRKLEKRALKEGKRFQLLREDEEERQPKKKKRKKQREEDRPQYQLEVVPSLTMDNIPMPPTEQKKEATDEASFDIDQNSQGGETVDTAKKRKRKRAQKITGENLKNMTEENVCIAAAEVVSFPQAVTPPEQFQSASSSENGSCPPQDTMEVPPVDMMQTLPCGNDHQDEDQRSENELIDTTLVPAESDILEEFHAPSRGRLPSPELGDLTFISPGIFASSSRSSSTSLQENIFEEDIQILEIPESVYGDDESIPGLNGTHGLDGVLEQNSKGNNYSQMRTGDSIGYDQSLEVIHENILPPTLLSRLGNTQELSNSIIDDTERVVAEAEEFCIGAARKDHTERFHGVFTIQ